MLGFISAMLGSCAETLDGSVLGKSGHVLACGSCGYEVRFALNA